MASGFEPGLVWRLSLKIARITVSPGVREAADGLGDHLGVASCLE
jgi:hypothetical protein